MTEDTVDEKDTTTLFYLVKIQDGPRVYCNSMRYDDNANLVLRGAYFAGGACDYSENEPMREFTLYHEPEYSYLLPEPIVPAYWKRIGGMADEIES